MKEYGLKFSNLGRKHLKENQNTGSTGAFLNPIVMKKEGDEKKQWVRGVTKTKGVKTLPRKTEGKQEGKEKAGKSKTRKPRRKVTRHKENRKSEEQKNDSMTKMIRKRRESKMRRLKMREYQCGKRKRVRVRITR